MDIHVDQSYIVVMKPIGASEFKARCLSILANVGPDGIVITKRGKPVAKLVPIRSDPRGLIGSLKGKLAIKGRILSTGAKWDAQS